LNGSIPGNSGKKAGPLQAAEEFDVLKGHGFSRAAIAAT
jgi:hypothetical protein